MSTFRSPNFRGQKAVILHREDDNVRRLSRHLDRLGMQSTVLWPDLEMPCGQFDVLYFDGDNGHDNLFPWEQGEPKVPIIVMIGSEAPGRLEWALAQNVSAHMIKPVQSSGVFSTLIIAYANFEQRREESIKIKTLQQRLANRPAVFRALLTIMEVAGVDDGIAYSILRTATMSHRQSIEDFCIQLDKRHARSLAQAYVSGKG